MLPIHALIEQECREISDLLIAKNKAYGNSFAEPINIFSKASAEEQINIRIDDKLNRIAKGSEKDAVPEDTEKDLIGYLVLKRVLRKINTPLVQVCGKLTEKDVFDYIAMNDNTITTAPKSQTGFTYIKEYV